MMQIEYCGSCLSGHFENSGFVRLDLPGEAKFAVDTGEPHKKRTTAKNLNKKFFFIFLLFSKH